MAFNVCPSCKAYHSTKVTVCSACGHRESVLPGFRKAGPAKR